MFRNTLLLILIATLFSCNSTNYKVIVGTETGGNSKGIYSLDFNSTTGILTNERLLCEVENPKFTCISEDQTRLYAVSNTKAGNVISYKWNDNKTKLIKIADHASLGKGPCHISLDKTNEYIAVSNYFGGSLFFSDKDFTTTRGIKHNGGFENSTRQNSAHVHCSFWSPDNKFLMVVDLGKDAIIAYPFNNGDLGQAHTALQLEQGNGARHLTFSSKKNKAYLATELSSQIYALDYDNQQGIFHIINTLSTLPDTFSENNKVAEIKISPNEKFVYVTNRGHNSIACYSINNNGSVTLIDITRTRGDFPRNFSITPDGQYLLVANQRSHNIVVFSISKKDGKLTYSSEYEGIDVPMSLTFVK